MEEPPEPPPPPHPAARLVEAFAEVAFVSSTASAHAALVKMHAHNEGIIFDNADGTVKLMIRPVFDDEDSVGSEDVEFQVCVLDEDEDDDGALTKALEREFDGAFDVDDDSVFIVDGIEIDKMAELDAAHPLVAKFAALVNRVHGWRLCECGLGFVKSGDDASCLRCVLTCSDVERTFLEDPENACIICMEPAGTRFSRAMSCCKKRTHDRCLKRWLDTSNSCPHCRAKVDERVEIIIDLIG